MSNSVACMLVMHLPLLHEHATCTLHDKTPPAAQSIDWRRTFRPHPFLLQACHYFNLAMLGLFAVLFLVYFARTIFVNIVWPVVRAYVIVSTCRPGLVAAGDAYALVLFFFYLLRHFRRRFRCRCRCLVVIGVIVVAIVFVVVSVVAVSVSSLSQSWSRSRSFLLSSPSTLFTSATAAHASVDHCRLCSRQPWI